MTIPKGGMYGAAILSVLIAVAIFITVASDVERTEYEVTKYNYVTDTTGLFQQEESPQYYDYDLSQSYTGYFTDVVTKYWDGVDYTKSDFVNTYILNIEPEAISSSTEDLSTSGISNQINNAVVWFYGPDGFISPSAAHQGNPVENGTLPTGNVLLRDVLSHYGLSSYNKITITPVNSGITDRILFASTDDFIHEFGGNNACTYTSQEHISEYSKWYNGGTLYDTRVAGLSCIVNYVTGYINYYSGPDPETSTLVRSVDIDKAIIIFGGTAVAPVYDVFGTSVHIEALELPPTEYLDTSKGVTVLSQGS